MAIPTKSLSDVLRRVTAHFRTSFPGLPLGVKKFLGRSARAFALPLWGLQKAIEDVDKDIIPSTKSSDDALSDWADRIGLTNGSGGFGRLIATKATGGEATLTGVNGTAYTTGLVATAEDGVTEIILTDDYTISGSPPGFGSVTEAKFEANAGSYGVDGNLPIGTVFTWQSPPSGADSTFTLTAPLEGGAGVESNADVFARISDRMQNPPRGGAVEDYKLWAQSAGATDVWVYPRRSGTGSVDIVIGVAGTGSARAPSAAVISAVQTAIDDARPVAVEEATVYAPTFNTGKLIRVRVTPSKTKYAFDWDDTAATYTVSSYSVGPPATITLNTPAPASLIAAVAAGDAETADYPRIQVLSTGSVINDPIRVVGVSGSDLTLETVPTGWVAPTSPNSVYAYGPVVATIAQAILDLVDSLGPSRVSGFGDTLAPWFDTLAISNIIRASEDSVDTDGVRLIFEVIVGGCTISGSVADIQATDNLPAVGPECLQALHIAVTQ